LLDVYFQPESISEGEDVYGFNALRHHALRYDVQAWHHALRETPWCIDSQRLHFRENFL
jgi:hypothetical protein